MVKQKVFFPLLLILGFIALMLLTKFTQKLEIPEKDMVSELRDSLQTSMERPLPDTFLINLWASWCQPCKKEMPDMVDIAKTANNKGRGHIGFFAVTDETQVETEEVRNKHAGFFKAYQELHEAESIKTIIHALREKRSIPANLIIQGDSCIYKGGMTDKAAKREIEKLLFESTSKTNHQPKP